MEEKKEMFAIWVKKHKTELIIAGISVTTVIAVILGVKNYNMLEQMWASLKKLVEKAPNKIPSATMPQVTKTVLIINETHPMLTPYDVSEHIRNLHEGWKASAEKMATAAEHGYDLKPGQTWVEAHTKGMAVA